MPEQPIVRIFVSSPRDDLDPERKTVAAAIRRPRDTATTPRFLLTSRGGGNNVPALFRKLPLTGRRSR